MHGADVVCARRHPGNGEPMPRPLTLTQSTDQRVFLAYCAQMGLPEPQPEWRFAPDRRWRFDWAWIGAKVALEIEGGVFTKGRHTRGAGFVRDMEKYNAATLLGWSVYRVTPDQLYQPQTLELLRAALAGSARPCHISLRTGGSPL